MPLLAQVGSLCAGHGSWPPSPVMMGSMDVMVEGKQATFQTGMVQLHTNPSPAPHPRSIAAGSSTVNINGKPAARIGDDIDCGGAIQMGCSTVKCG